MKNDLRIVAVQANAPVGAIDDNLRRIVATRRRLRDADLLVFPECFLSGYPLEDLALRPSFVARVGEALRALARIVREEDGPAIVVGAPIAGGRLPFNAAVLVRRDGTTAIAAKTELPNTDVFDEVRVFATNKARALPLELDGWRLGLAVCEDVWHAGVARDLAGELADVLIAINGSPFEVGKDAVRREHMARRARETGLPGIYLNLVGGQDEIVFDGASFAMDPDGNVLTAAPAFREAELHLRLSRRGRDRILTAEDGAWQPALSREEAIWSATTLGLRDYVRKTGHERVLLGVSGGIDSAVVATMAVDALGARNVLGVMMPSRFTSADSLELASELCARLGIALRIWPIDTTKDAAQSVLEGVAGAGLAVAHENLQSRIRGLALMAISNAEGRLLLSTGNKSEMSVGYATLYGDMNGGFNPLKDIYKTDVFALAEWRNASNPTLAEAPVPHPIPQGIISRPPSAELSEGQSDEAALGSYTVLDALLSGMIEGNLDAEAARRMAEKRLGVAIPAEHARRIASLLARSEFKRRQAPPGVKISPRSFGKGWRYPIAHSSDL